MPVANRSTDARRTAVAASIALSYTPARTPSKKRVVGVRANEPRGTHEDERLGRQIDVLLVLGAVAPDRLVTELRQLDARLLRGDAVDAVAHHGPRTAQWRVPLRGGRDRGTVGDHR